MQDEEIPQNYLDGWDAIASELKVSVRQAQNWEKSDRLPVRRMPGKKGRVFASQEELSRWQRNRILGATLSESAAPLDVSSLPQPVNSPSALEPKSQESAAENLKIAEMPGFGTQGSRLPFFLRRRINAALCVGLLVLLLCVSIWGVSNHHDAPDHFELKERTLRILDDRDREVWKRSLPGAVREMTLEDRNQETWFGRLEGTPGISFLFPYKPLPWEEHGTELQCYSETGRVLWTWHPGRTVADGQRTYSPLYSTSNVRVLPGSNGSQTRIIVSANHVESHPNQVVALDSGGKVLGEYWHSGHLNSTAVADIDGDGKPEILLAGVDNGHHEATLVVLDPEHLGGASVQQPGDPYQLRGFSPGQEKAIVWFPRDRIAKRYQEYTRAYSVTVSPGMIVVVVSETIASQGPYVLYRLNWNLDLIDVEESGVVRNWYQQMVAEGKIDHGFTEQDHEDLKRIKVIKRY